MKKTIVALVAMTLTTMSCGAMAHHVIPIPPVLKLPAPTPAPVPAAIAGGGGIDWIPFVAVAGALGYAIYLVHECDKKPLTDKCHPEAVRQQALKALAPVVPPHVAKRKASRLVAGKRIHKEAGRAAAACQPIAKQK